MFIYKRDLITEYLAQVLAKSLVEETALFLRRIERKGDQNPFMIAGNMLIYSMGYTEKEKEVQDQNLAKVVDFYEKALDKLLPFTMGKVHLSSLVVGKIYYKVIIYYLSIREAQEKKQEIEKQKKKVEKNLEKLEKDLDKKNNLSDQAKKELKEFINKVRDKLSKTQNVCNSNTQDTEKLEKEVDSLRKEINATAEEVFRKLVEKVKDDEKVLDNLQPLSGELRDLADDLSNYQNKLKELQSAENHIKDVDKVLEKVFDEDGGLKGFADKLQEKEEQMNEVAKFIFGSDLDSLSQTEKVVVSLIYKNITQDAMQYLGEMIKVLEESNRKIEEYVDPSTKTAGSDLMRMRYENFYDDTIFEKRLVEDNLLLKDKKIEESAGYGAFVMCVDKSDSMSGDKLEQARAVAMFYGIQAIKRNIPFVLVGFGSRASGDLIKPAGHSSDYLELAMAVQKHLSSTAGGTEYHKAIETALELLSKSKLLKADLLFISDGEPAKDDLDTKEIKESMETFKNRVFIGVGFKRGENWAWNEYFTKIINTDSKDFHLKSATDIDEIIRENLNYSPSI